MTRGKRSHQQSSSMPWASPVKLSLLTRMNVNKPFSGLLLWIPGEKEQILILYLPEKVTVKSFLLCTPASEFDTSYNVASMPVVCPGWVRPEIKKEEKENNDSSSVRNLQDESIPRQPDWWAQPNRRLLETGVEDELERKLARKVNAQFLPSSTSSLNWPLRVTWIGAR